MYEFYGVIRLLFFLVISMFDSLMDTRHEVIFLVFHAKHSSSSCFLLRVGQDNLVMWRTMDELAFFIFCNLTRSHIAPYILLEFKNVTENVGGRLDFEYNYHHCLNGTVILPHFSPLERFNVAQVRRTNRPLCTSPNYDRHERHRTAHKLIDRSNYFDLSFGRRR